jgi:DNA sulfur modification protein DndE
MKPPIESIRVSARSREILITLKRKTGIANWNIICRGAFCDSLANPDPPVSARGSTESNVEMSWETFAGNLSEVLSERSTTVRPAREFSRRRARWQPIFETTWKGEFDSLVGSLTQRSKR